LDEFDHALDGQYRKSIASLISSLSDHSQFIITTFKPELVKQPRAKLFQVTFENRKSKLQTIDIKKALSIIQPQNEDKVDLS